MAAGTYAMEAMTSVTAGLIDRGLEDYMLETAMLKVFSTEALWTIVNDAFQIHGGAAYFTDQPLERMLRDARINQIGEGANEVLRRSSPWSACATAAKTCASSGRRCTVRGAGCPCSAASPSTKSCDGSPTAPRRAIAGSSSLMPTLGRPDPPLRARRRARVDSASRGDRRPAVRPRADRAGGHGALRVGVRAQPPRRRAGP